MSSVPQRPLHAVQLPSGPRLLEALRKALEGTGPAVFPLSPHAPAARVRTLVRAMRPASLTTPKGTSALSGGVPVAEDTALVVATSGSGGEPKGVELPGAALVHSAKATLDYLDATPGESWLACLPADHIAGAQVLVRSIVAGTEPSFMPDGAGRKASFDPEVALSSGADYVSVVPTMLDRLLAAAGRAGADLSAFRAILLGGAPASPALLQRARSAGGVVVTTYGLTETCGGCIYDGLPIAGVHASLAGDGRIRIAGATLFSGYRMDPPRTAAAMDGPWLATQDLGAWENDRLRVRGRADDVIVTGGHNVVPAEVSTLLGDHPGVADVTVVGRSDPEWGERIVAVIVPTDPQEPPSLDDVRAHVRGRAPAYLAPHELEVVGAIPTLASGKPDLPALRRGFG